MKIIDDIRSAVGDDKLLHFLVYGLAVALAALFGLPCCIAAFALMGVLSFAKEFLDAYVNPCDIIAGVAGGLLSLASCIAATIIKKNMTPLTKIIGIAILVCFCLAFVGFIAYTVIEHRKAVKELENHKNDE